MCRHCARHVSDEGCPAAAGSDALRLHEYWDHLDLFQANLEPEVAAAAATKGTRRRGKRGKEARRMAKVKDRATEAESAPEETKPVCVAASKLNYLWYSCTLHGSSGIRNDLPHGSESGTNVNLRDSYPIISPRV